VSIGEHVDGGGKQREMIFTRRYACRLFLLDEHKISSPFCNFVLIQINAELMQMY